MSQGRGAHETYNSHFEPEQIFMVAAPNIFLVRENSDIEVVRAFRPIWEAT